MVIAPSDTNQFDRVCRVGDSSNVSELAYSINSRQLRITFNNGIKYLYLDVDAKTFGMLVASQSVGKAISKLLKTFSYERLGN